MAMRIVPGARSVFLFFWAGFFLTLGGVTCLAAGEPPEEPPQPLLESGPTEFLDTIPRANSRQGGGGGIGRPHLEDLRPIQFDYSADGGTLICIWKILDGAFDQIKVYVDGNLGGEYPGDIQGVNFGRLSPGLHHLGIEAYLLGRVFPLEINHVIMTESPVPSVEITRWLAYAFRASPEGGFLEIQWRNRHREIDPYVEYEFKVNGIYQGRRPAFRTNTTFSKVLPGEYTIEIIAFTRNYAAMGTRQLCIGKPLPGPTDLRIDRVECAAERMVAEISYQIPPDQHYSKVAVWNLNPGEKCNLFERCFLGYADPSLGKVRINNLPIQPTLIEIAGVMPIEGEAEPRLFSSLPLAPGEHSTILCTPDGNCAVVPKAKFRRGDAEPDGALQLTDAVLILLHLFRGKPAPCRDAMDYDDDGEVAISDPILLLRFLFAHGHPPLPPGPFQCGLDPTADELDNCEIPFCAPQ